MIGSSERKPNPHYKFTYVVSGIRALLDADNEWVYDARTKQVFYRASGGANSLSARTGKCSRRACTLRRTKPRCFARAARTVEVPGATWSWQREGRGVLFQPADRRHMAVSPWLAQRSDGTMICVFATDEDRSEPDRPGTPPARFSMDIKCVFSRDDGQTWTRPAQPVLTNSHRAYAPGVAVLRDDSWLVTFTDFSAKRFRAMRGELTSAIAFPVAR